jgi:hypothetical protein
MCTCLYQDNIDIYHSTMVMISWFPVYSQFRSSHDGRKTTSVNPIEKIFHSNEITDIIKSFPMLHCITSKSS